MGLKQMKQGNITTVKVNSHEIAKASDMEFGFKSVLENITILADRLYASHKPLVDDANFAASAGYIGRDIKDFVIGGGLVSAGGAILRPLPMVAFSKAGGVFITNGKDFENKDIHIPLGENLQEEGYRIDSIYIGNAWTGETGSAGETMDKKDFNWDEFASEWRASYQLNASSDVDMQFSEFKKRQMQAVRFYVYPGIHDTDKANARAAASPELFNGRVKIAEVLVHCTVEPTGGMPKIEDIKPDDVRYVTAVQYWEGDDTAALDAAKQADSKWVQHAFIPQPNYQPGMTYDEKEAERARVERIGIDNKAERAEHYNYRWTNEQVRTYSLGSVAEISERLYKIVNTDGSIKEAVIGHKHINLNSTDEKSLKSNRIPVGIDLWNGAQDIVLPYNGKIEQHDSVHAGLLKIAEKMIAGDAKVTAINDDLQTHKNNKTVHGATSDPTPQRLAFRDSNGRMQAEDPVKPKEVVNINYLNSQFKLDVVMKVLMSKLINNQEEFDMWINQKNNEGYTFVYLKGNFTSNKSINMQEIGTREITGISKPKITVSCSSFTIIGVDKHSHKVTNLNIKGNGNGIQNCHCHDLSLSLDGNLGISNCNISASSGKIFDVILRAKNLTQNKVVAIASSTIQSEVSVNVSVPDEESVYKNYTTDTYFSSLIGIDSCTLNAKASVRVNARLTTPDRYYLFSNTRAIGCHAIGFNNCTTQHYASSDVVGGNGGHGIPGYSPDYHGHGDDGDVGYKGGNAYPFKNCVVNKSSIYEFAIGGYGGKGGRGGDTGTFWGVCRIGTNGGNGGKGGDGGDAYVFKNSSGIPGEGALGGDGGDGCTGGKNGNSGARGGFGKVHIIS